MTQRSIFARPKFLIPLVVFLSVAGFFALGLRLDSTLVPSPLVGKSAPSFQLPLLHMESESLQPEQLNGAPWLLNVWASWCVACRDEHQLLLDLAGQGVVIIGLNYKDDPGQARRWLRELGNPYLVTAVDNEGSTAIDWGVYGVPETFLIDPSGIIRYKHIGPLSAEVIAEKILPLIQEQT